MQVAVPSIPAGSRLDHYALEELVATTSTAAVFKATDLSTGRPVAIKLPHLEVQGDPLFYERFHREQEVGAKLDHPSIVKFFTDAKRSRKYIVMEWAEGKLLRHVLHEQGKLPADRAIRITVNLCEALHYMHEQGVAHRDLKPENIMVDASDGIKLIDFGIAGLAGARRLTFGKFSQVMGTPDYISPEQVQGKRGDSRSDIYAAGVILYEMLTGVTPFPGDNPLAVMNNRLVNHPRPPREANPEISRELQEILYRALEFDPAKRYGAARDLAWDLQHQDEIVVAERPELHAGRRPRVSVRTRLSYVYLILAPLATLALLLYAAHRR